jgi:hypothetical protein
VRSVHFLACGAHSSAAATGPLSRFVPAQGPHREVAVLRPWPHRQRILARDAHNCTAAAESLSWLLAVQGRHTILRDALHA